MPRDILTLHLVMSFVDMQIQPIPKQNRPSRFRPPHRDFSDINFSPLTPYPSPPPSAKYNDRKHGAFSNISHTCRAGRPPNPRPPQNTYLRVLAPSLAFPRPLLPQTPSLPVLNRDISNPSNRRSIRLTIRPPKTRISILPRPNEESRRCADPDERSGGCGRG